MHLGRSCVCVCVCMFLFIHSVIYTFQSSKLFPASRFFLPSCHIQNVQGTDTRDASHINASHFLPCCTVHKHTGFLPFMSEQRSILLIQCYWIPNYPRVLNFWLISHGLMLVFLDTCFFQLPDSYEFWYLYYWQTRGLTTEGMRERYLAVQHCNMQSCSIYRVKARAEIKSFWSSWSNITPLRRSVLLQEDSSLFQMM